MRKKVLVAMSGGVDSSVAAALLKKQGFEVIGIFLKFWAPPQPPAQRAFRLGERGSAPAGRFSQENKCCSLDAVEQARKVAQKLNIPFYVLDYRAVFKREVVDYFLAEYKAGRTPNPCVKCNQFIKFGKLWDKARELGADFLATGHYVRLISPASKKFARSTKKDVRFSLARGLESACDPLFWLELALFEGVDKTKDQSYFLWAIEPEILKHLLFPLGDFTKKEVRKMAQKWGLPTASRKESQEICFVHTTLWEFLAKYIKVKKGDIINLKGKILGKHQGAWFYTLGQRHSLDIEPSSSSQEPYYVIKTDIKKNIVYVGRDKELYKKSLIAENVNWLVRDRDLRQRFEKKGFECEARIRYGHPAIPCRVSKLKRKNEKVKIIFNKPQRAITPGQSVVFYKGEQMLGGGIITR